MHNDRASVIITSCDHGFAVQAARLCVWSAQGIRRNDQTWKLVQLVNVTVSRIILR
jgi:carbamoylphosphate synthase small subunit